MKIDMIRLQIQCPHPPECLPRSGALLLDCHEIRITAGSMPPARRPGTRFAVADPSETTALPKDFDETSLMEADFKRLLVACSPISSQRATSILSFGPLHPGGQDTGDVRQIGTSEILSSLQPHLSITKLTPHSKERSSVTALSFNIPFVQIDVVKHVLDGLQFWADDISQLIERTFNSDGDNGQSKNLGPLSTRTRITNAPIRSSSGGRNEIVVKVVISDGISSIRCSCLSNERFTSICQGNDSRTSGYTCCEPTYHIRLRYQRRC